MDLQKDLKETGITLIEAVNENNLQKPLTLQE